MKVCDANFVSEAMTDLGKAMMAEKARADRLRLELEKIAWMDEFLDADGARAMMNIAREAIRNDE